ncbi:aminotransferase class IV [Solitalea koreensis]|uniref:branched-chain-amino-acid transaminase n=1 Tax=Solitalea koreensis TaxID=543615 RepID=A0A521DWT3_9SPHI|nr:aminotransferase class IV [Solitalea koreensis]SMO76199.1 branched-chain amino acid aminotransferase [Solitalea koreensis]
MHNHFINFNGQIIPEQEPVLTSSNRAFRYGDGLFESVRMSSGELKFLDLHAERLQTGMKTLRMSNYHQFTAEFVIEQVHQLAKSNKIFDHARIRVSVFREGAGLYTPVTNEAGFLIEMHKLEEGPYELNRKGLIIDVFKDVKKNCSTLSWIKSSNSLLYVLAAIYKNEIKADECLLMNDEGYLVEGTSSNLFLVKNGELYTPALTEGCVAGVMRNVIFKMAQHTSLKIHEVKIKPEALFDADEIFMTNATRGIQWVVGYHEKRYFNDFSKMLVAMLNRFVL